MMPGPAQFLKILPSGSLVKITTLISGNTFGALFWTDGKCEAPMLPDQPWLRCHPQTDELFWTDECEKITKGIANPDHVPYAEAPTLDQYTQALKIGLGSTPRKEAYIRRRYWWAANDPVRAGEISAPVAVDFKENLLKFRALLNTEDPDDRLTAAEVSRELQDFKAADLLLDFQFPQDYMAAVKLIGKLTREGDAIVRQFD